MDKLLAYCWSNCWPSNLHQSCTKCHVKTLSKHYKNRHFRPTSANTTQNQAKFTHYSVYLLRKKKPGGCMVDKLLALSFFLVVQVLLLGSLISFSFLFEFFFLSFFGAFFSSSLLSRSFFFLCLFSSILFFFLLFLFFVLFFSSSSLLVLLFLSCS